MLKDVLTGKLNEKRISNRYIGSELIDYLLKDGYSVIAIDNLMYDPVVVGILLIQTFNV